MSDTEVPPLSSLLETPPLAHLLSLLFEPTPILLNLLVPAVLLRLTAASNPPSTYVHVIDVCAEEAASWTWEQKAEFLSGHPMIGEQGKVSALSGKEQGQAKPTPPAVLARLAHLNLLYCTIYPGLRFITFVNSRPRSAIVTEMEENMGLVPSPVPIPDDYPVDHPAVDSLEVIEKIRMPDSEEWQGECERGMADVWRIGRARLKGLGKE